jgi:VWFA-related protein
MFPFTIRPVDCDKPIAQTRREDENKGLSLPGLNAEVSRNTLMMALLKSLSLPLLAFALVTPAVSRAQQAASPNGSGQQTISLDVIVAHKNGKPIANLQQQDFTLLDNNAAQPITRFQAFSGTQVPVTIMLVVDAVNTSFTNLGIERQQIDKFLRANEGQLPHPVALAIFTDTGTRIQQAPSTDGNQLAASLDQADIGLRQIHRGSQFEGDDRLNLSMSTLQSLTAELGPLPGRKVIFWVSPGWPLLSGPRINLDSKQQEKLFSQVVNVSTTLRRDDITLYAIDPFGAGQSVLQEFYYESFLKGVKHPSETDLADLSLQVLAVQTGGLALPSSNDIAAHLQQCMDDLSAFYRISFNAPPLEQPNQYHRIDVKLSTPGLTARTRTGYYTAYDTPAAAVGLTDGH